MRFYAESPTRTRVELVKVLVPLMVRREACKEMPENVAALKRLIEAT